MIERSSFRTATTVSGPADVRRPAANVLRQRLTDTNFFSRRIVFSISTVVILGLLICGAMYFLRPPANINPFTAKVAASMQFPLYYPKVLPTGFRIDPRSVTVPKAGVVVFDLVGPKSQKLYISEEARPERFDIGGFYKKFSDLDEIGITGGSVTTGTFNGSSMGAWLDNKDWILCNTTAPVPLVQIQAMLKSLVVNS